MSSPEGSPHVNTVLYRVRIVPGVPYTIWLKLSLCAPMVDMYERACLKNDAAVCLWRVATRLGACCSA